MSTPAEALDQIASVAQAELAAKDAEIASLRAEVERAWNASKYIERTEKEHAEVLRAERDALSKFKAYVHKRLDDAGVPTHPDGPHSKEGCRIGDRLDLLLQERERLLHRLTLPRDGDPTDDAVAQLHELERVGPPPGLYGFGTPRVDVAAARRRGECGAVVGGVLCRLPIGHWKPDAPAPWVSAAAAAGVEKREVPTYSLLTPADNFPRARHALDPETYCPCGWVRGCAPPEQHAPGCEELQR